MSVKEETAKSTNLREVVREEDDLRETYKLSDKEVDVASRSRDNLVMRVTIQVKRRDVEILQRSQQHLLMLASASLLRINALFLQTKYTKYCQIDWNP